MRRISVFERSGRTGPEDQDYSPIYVGDVTERSVAGGEEFREEQHQQRMLRHVFRLFAFFWALAREEQKKCLFQLDYLPVDRY